MCFVGIVGCVYRFFSTVQPPVKFGMPCVLAWLLFGNATLFLEKSVGAATKGAQVVW